MSNKGTQLSIISKTRISLANTKDRTELHAKINEYIESLKENDFPSITKASLFAGVSEKMLLSYEARTAENSNIRVLLDHIRDLQKEYLTVNGLQNKTNSNLTILLLKANHDLKDSPTQLTQNNNFNLTPEILAEALELARNKK